MDGRAANRTMLDFLIDTWTKTRYSIIMNMKPKIEKGSTLCCHWGYDDDKYTFYRVIDKTDRTVKYAKLALSSTSTGTPMTSLVSPSETIVGTTKTARIKEGPFGQYIKIADLLSSASVWDGLPKFETYAR